MTTGWGLFKKGGSLAGLMFRSCGLPLAAHSQMAPARLPVTVRGKRIKTVDVHAHWYFQEALDIAGQAVEVLQRNGNRTGHISYVDQIEEINGAVSARRCATADEAIEQLEALAAVFDRQILSNVYW